MQKDRPHVGLHIRGRKRTGKGQHARRRRRPNTGKRSQLIIGFRKTALVLSRANISRALQGKGTAVVAKTLPCLKHIGSRSRSQGVNRWKSRHKARPIALHPRYLRLLQHDLRDQNGVRVARIAPRKIAVELIAALPHTLNKALARGNALPRRPNGSRHRPRRQQNRRQDRQPHRPRTHEHPGMRPDARTNQPA